jgi:thioredoxin family protein
VTRDGARGMKKQSAPVAEQRLYQLVRQKNPIVDRTFSIEFLDAVVVAFSFTFG